nr:alpha-tocopherol transfer protein-like [Onthophagus taurus]
MTVLPKKTKENYSVMITRLIDSSPEFYDYNNQIKVIDMVGTLTLMQRGPSDGQAMIMDSEGFGFAHMMKANLTSSRKHLTFVQEALPIRLKAIHIVNVSPTTEKFLGILKPFIKKELFDMIHLHRTPEGLHDYINKDDLPNEYGGKLGSFKELHQEMLKNVTENMDFFVQNEKLVADESKRQGKPKNMGDIFGIEGTFKKLDID